MFGKILIANRGVIAKRVIDACKDLGISTVAVYTPEDRDSLHVQEADESYCVRKYNEPAEIISVAEHTGADAIHPGVGFLSENIEFVKVLSQYDHVFIGPSLDAIQMMGDKVRARRIAHETHVPITPGSPGSVKSEKDLVSAARAIGYPLMIKAAAGGGGMGMSLIHNQHELVDSYRSLTKVAMELFSNPDLYLERFVKENRHIEVQVLGDLDGDVIHLGERDCSFQRRHQKLIEFSPSDIPSAVRHELLSCATRLSREIGYHTAGTVEFLYDGCGNFYFMEMNTRIQVEHRVTEMLTGMDLIVEQIRLAAGERLERKQPGIRFDGFALECRINAEDPDNDFEATPGVLTKYIVPCVSRSDGVIIDTFIPRIENGASYKVTSSYDSLLANVIVRGNTKQEALGLMKDVLSQFIIDGDKIKTTIPYHQSALDRI